MANYSVGAYIDQKENNKTYKPGVPNPLKTILHAYVPYDEQSKRFKKYTHEFQYALKTEYNPKDCNLYIYDPRAWFYNYVFVYSNPSKKVLSVDVFFPLNDTGNEKPLIIGFNEEERGMTYYTYNFLKDRTLYMFSYRATHNNLPQHDRFYDEDLITRLLEELGWLGSNRQHRLVIELNKKPPEGVSITYPKTGHNAEKITVKKDSDQNKQETQLKEINSYFDKYTHTFIKKETYSGFYVSLGFNTVFLDTEGRYKVKPFESVDVYYPKTNSKKFIIVILNFTGIKKLFKYTEFEDYLSKPDPTVKISSFKKLDDINLFEKLKEENDKIDENVVYLIENNADYSYKVEIKSGTNELGEEYKKYTHTPKIQYKHQKSLLLYNGKVLVKKEKNNFKPFNELNGILYKTVDVYFGLRNLNIPLIIKLTKSEGNTAEYYKRNQEGKVEYWEKEEIKDTPNDISELTKVLKKEESNLFDSLFVFIDKQEKYIKKDLEKLPNVKLTSSQPEEIEVKQNEDCPKLRENNFKCFEHNINLLSSESTSTNNKVKFQLFFTNKAEMNLYDNNTVTYLYSENNNENKLYVYYYNDDPRPLILCYEGKAYRPKDLSNYFNSWIKIANINKCPCKDEEGISLLNELKNILYFMFPVRLQQYSSKYDKQTKYTTHSFYKDSGDSHVMINVKAEDMNCYRKYTHTSDNSSSILGEISHNGMRLFSNYTDYENKTSQKFKFPSSVIVCYYLYDFIHEYPLLVVLNYDTNGDGGGNSGSDNQYYRLGGPEGSNWSKLTETVNLDDQEKLEIKLREIRENLNIYLEKTEENLIIASSDNCHEGGVAGPVAGTITTLGLAGTGIGLGYYFRPDIFIGIYRRLI